MTGRFSWKALIAWLVFAIALAVLDQWTKGWIQQHITAGDHMHITSFFNLVLAYNSGAAFSFLADAGGWQKTLFCGIAAAVCLIGCLVIGFRSSRFWLCLAIALIMGGAIGNCYDRVTLGLVVDFLDFHFLSYHWPAFNVADTCICVGAGLFLLVEFFNIGSKKGKYAYR